MRLIVRRVKPSRQQMKNLTAFEIKTGWRYSITATNIRHMWGIAGSQYASGLTFCTARTWWWKVLKIPDTWPWRTLFSTCWQRLSELPAVT
jgi:hypothetical protein